MKSLLTTYFGGTMSEPGKRCERSPAPTETSGGSDMAKRICSIDGCENSVVGWGWCRAHYKRFRRHGDPLAGGPSPRDLRGKLAELLAIETDECLLWPFAGNAKYGVMKVGGRTIGIHVIVCERRHGLRPSDRHEAAHACGRPLCVNSRHLRWATPAENAADKLIHGTDQRGSRNGSVKLTVDQVREIRTRRGDGETLKALAVEFGVTECTISAIALRRKWGWLDA